RPVRLSDLRGDGDPSRPGAGDRPGGDGSAAVDFDRRVLISTVGAGQNQHPPGAGEILLGLLSKEGTQFAAAFRSGSDSLRSDASDFKTAGPRDRSLDLFHF